jgi:hypothetical protein
MVLLFVFHFFFILALPVYANSLLTDVCVCMLFGIFRGIARPFCRVNKALEKKAPDVCPGRWFESIHVAKLLQSIPFSGMGHSFSYWSHLGTSVWRRLFFDYLQFLLLKLSLPGNVASMVDCAIHFISSLSSLF